MLLSRQEEKAIQRRILCTPDGEVKLSVHCVPVRLEDLTPKTEFPRRVVLTKGTVNQFVDRVITIISVLRNYEICAGQSDVSKKHVWSSIQGATVDSNPYKECRYTETLRSEQRSRLVPTRKWLCSECDKLSAPIRRRVAAYNKEEPHPCTPNTALSEEQKLKKLATQQEKN